VNIIADPSWDEARFNVVREWAMSVPEIVHLTVNTPYSGTETWTTDARSLATRNYKLFDVQHAVLPTRLPLRRRSTPARSMFSSRNSPAPRWRPTATAALAPPTRARAWDEAARRPRMACTFIQFACKAGGSTCRPDRSGAEWRDFASTNRCESLKRGPLCPEHLRECANGRLLEQPPVAGPEPAGPEGRSL